MLNQKQGLLTARLEGHIILSCNYTAFTKISLISIVMSTNPASQKRICHVMTVNLINNLKESFLNAEFKRRHEGYVVMTFSFVCTEMTKSLPLNMSARIDHWKTSWYFL